jgi:hypothetical protein
MIETGSAYAVSRKVVRFFGCIKYVNGSREVSCRCVRCSATQRDTTKNIQLQVALRNNWIDLTPAFDFDLHGPAD